MVKNVTLKRTVTIKAIVTEDFKSYLTYELEGAIQNLKSKISEIEKQAQLLIESLKKDGATDQINSIDQQLRLEKQQQFNLITDLEKRIKEAKALQLDTEFVQGTIEGFVAIKPGDNLYQKLGALEIIIKDGVVQDIKGDTEG